MTDLRSRMRIYDRAPAPDYWTEIELRASSASVRTAAPARSARPLLLLAAAMLLALAVGGAALALSRLVDPPPGSSVTHLAYGLDGDIYLADADGQNPVRIADGEPAGENGELEHCSTLGGGGPIWSPDGRYVAYRSQWDDVCEGIVYLSDAEGNPVASFPGVGWLISWSPDSTRVATWVQLWHTIGIYGIDGERQALLTVPAGCGSGDHDPVWSPDGASVVVESWRCEMPIDGGTPRPLPAGDVRSHYTWVYSPDGTRVAYVEIRGEGDRSLVIAEADGTVLHVIDDDSWYEGVVWSPSGDRVLYSSAPLGGSGADLRKVDIGTGQVTTLASEPGILPLGFSAEGDRILFSTRGFDEGPDGPVVVDSGLWSMNADGSDPQLLVPNTTWGEWQPITGSN